MKRALLADVIRKHGRRIKRYGDQLPGHFEVEMVHDLRLEYKKLRAFTRLLKESRKARDIGIPPEIKSVYHTAGRVRDFQLFIPLVMARQETEGVRLNQYTSSLEQRLFTAKELLVKAIEKLKANKAIDQLTTSLPSYLDDKIVRRFIHRKIASVQVMLLALEKDRELHAIRKQLKDIILNIRIFDSDWGISFPVTAWRSEKRLHEVASMLGDFNDRCIALSFLSDSTLHALPEEEKAHLVSWRTALINEKQQIMQKLMEQLQQLHLISNFEKQY
ncbi:CHAD domain-containing protein [Paraflavitalea sp. CAU 1676]|uniref:CHAD domain-containing protein n=1 Tax=Paraflavitalea sp. CAU 1676 TaxID=3032598 RepID=UPI0023DA2F8C|nr:CHAD domain-containing protein [Paraflavitalea sp. CAU 1676]MDF2193066.1 CHAD domain-containing protein [Paraflavitalea sp. CAU 1676]